MCHFEAVIFGIPAIAASLQVISEDLKFKDSVQEIDYSHAEKILRKLVKKIIEYDMPKGVNIFNLNIPAKFKSDETVQTNFADKNAHYRC